MRILLIELLQELNRRQVICKECEHKLCRGASSFSCYAHVTQEELDVVQAILDARKCKETK